jgi:DNA polymerase I-like protein with 3'-5' exonuclease and polymerase domains
MRLLFDIEGNGLLDTVTKIWMVVVTDLDSKKQFVFCDDAYEEGEPDVRPTREFADLMNQASAIYGHFILGYDLPALKKVLGYELPSHIKVYDTMLMSQVLDYNRFGNGRHSLELWGEHLGHKKPEHEDWLNYSPEMLHRCKEDVNINVKVYERLSNELVQMAKKKPYIKQSLRNEHDVLKFCAMAEEKGWLFNMTAAKELIALIDTEMKAIEANLVPQLSLEIELIDKVAKEPKWNKNGKYSANTCKVFGVEPDDGLLDDPPVTGAFQRIRFVEPDLGSIESVKGLLYKHGWEPDDWNWKRGPAGNFVKVSPKLTTTSLEPLGEIGAQVDKYYTLRSRHQIVSGWLESIGDDGRLHGECFTIATPTGRARHKGLVNVPSADGTALFGKEIRSLFITRPGWKVVGADSAGNQMRAFCHYLNNENYTKEVIDGDVHTANQQILIEVVPSVTRKIAKPFLYAYLFGAGSEKVGLILTGKRDAKIGKRAKDIFAEKIPGLKELINRITNVYNQTHEAGAAWIPAIDGRRIYVDSPHKALNYLLQSCEGVTCKAAVAMFMNETSKRGYVMGKDWNPLIFYHDEFEIECPEHLAQEFSTLMQECFRDAPKQFGVMVMDGASKIGDNWYDVH